MKQWEIYMFPFAEELQRIAMRSLGWIKGRSLASICHYQEPRTIPRTVPHPKPLTSTGG